MALALSKILLANAPANTTGAYLQTVTVSSVGAGNVTSMINAQYIPAGLHLALPHANVTIEVNNYDTTNSANVWSIMMAANTGGVVFSDGFNVRANSIGGTQSVTLLTVDGGNAASGTFNS